MKAPRSYIRHADYHANSAMDWVTWVELSSDRLLGLAYDGEHRVITGNNAKELLKDIKASVMWVLV